MSYRDTATVITAAALLLTTPVVAAAAGEGQTAVAIFAGAGGITPDDKFTFWVGPTWRVGGGVEHRFASGLLLQGELELLERPRSPGDGDTVLPSFNAGFASSRQGVRPFVSGGFTLAGNDLGINYGGGVDIPVAPRIAARIEFRDHVLVFDTPVHSYGVRVGLLFH